MEKENSQLKTQPANLFIGLDLAWSARHNTGAAVISSKAGSGEGEITHWREELGGNEEILDFITEISPAGATSTTLIAIDAPLAVPNETGARPCDRHLSSVFRRYQAGTHPTNRTNLGRYGVPPGDIRGEALSRLLAEKLGFSHNPYLRPRQPVRQFFECYPHPAMVVLFQLPLTLKYKRKLRSFDNNRFEAYNQFKAYLEALSLPGIEPRLHIPAEILNRDVREIGSASALKHYEDLLDAIMCSYIAFYYWWWGEEKCIIFGNNQAGHIVTPVNPFLRELALQNLTSS